jgi:hypothetical protein
MSAYKGSLFYSHCARGIKKRFVFAITPLSINLTPYIIQLQTGKMLDHELLSSSLDQDQLIPTQYTVVRNII